VPAGKAAGATFLRQLRGRGGALGRGRRRSRGTERRRGPAMYVSRACESSGLQIADDHVVVAQMLNGARAASSNPADNVRVLGQRSRPPIAIRRSLERLLEPWGGKRPGSPARATPSMSRARSTHAHTRCRARPYSIPPKQRTAGVSAGVSPAELRIAGAPRSSRAAAQGRVNGFVKSSCRKKIHRRRATARGSGRSAAKESGWLG